jgi:hypothetical protein
MPDAFDLGGTVDREVDQFVRPAGLLGKPAGSGRSGVACFAGSVEAVPVVMGLVVAADHEQVVLVPDQVSVA